MHILEKITYVCLISASMISMGLVIENRLNAPVPQVPPQQLVGKHVNVDGLNWKRSQLHTVLFTSTRCRFCAASLPFYKRLTTEQRAANVSISVISVQPTDEMKRLLSLEDVRVDGVYNAPKMPGLFVTPTVLIVDGAGIVKKLFVGQLDSVHEQEVLQIVSAGAVKG